MVIKRNIKSLVKMVENCYLQIYSTFPTFPSIFPPNSTPSTPNPATTRPTSHSDFSPKIDSGHIFNNLV